MYTINESARQSVLYASNNCKLRGLQQNVAVVVPVHVPSGMTRREAHERSQEYVRRYASGESDTEDRLSTSVSVCFQGSKTNNVPHYPSKNVLAWFRC